MSAPVVERHESPRSRLREGALAYADAGDDEAGFARADDRLAKAAEHFVLSLPKYRQLLQATRRATPRFSARSRTLPAVRGQLELPLG